jgi:alkanesulfonate monooxygenase SsuD/methylene tetrahydromethanopterin reductase-like flavin-dependent oxidoreductase (luciferase family)
VPKPYQRPHPPLFQAFSISEETVRWCAREGITPTILISQPPLLRKLVEAYRDEAAKAGRQLNLGESVGVLRAVYLADSHAQAQKLAEDGVCGLAFRRFFYHFGFFEAWREAEDEARYGKNMLPVEEATTARMERADFAYMGTVDDVQRKLDAMVENVHPEWFVWQGDQGLLPTDVVRKQIETFGKHLLTRYK